MATRTARGVLARKDFSFAQLAERISVDGTPESLRGTESKIHRGTYSHTLYADRIPPHQFSHQIKRWAALT
ncbi:DUF6471 domain-containing protein [Cupriavidus basilensis]|uniref:DUF6471 domain-containing protein n=1 Tax=Cupriavidus basilensis TaxID=68895 RepID=UPI0028502B81|nr:DUF6471 domain-containing protein [Cupriavidus basilensis]MDR3383749.1 DUF6471 domain-containing protein [Cupriavidus basilensis]